MSNPNNTSSFLFSSWLRNAEQWIGMLSDEPFPAIKYSSDQAAFDTVMRYKPKTVLDIGSTDGALVNQLTIAGIQSTGIEGIKEFTTYAQQKMQGEFIFAETLEAVDSLIDHKYDLILFNYGLFMDESLSKNLLHSKKWLNEEGYFLVQSIHPSVVITAQKTYQEGWMANLWNADQGEGPTNPFPVYFRTLEDWYHLFSESNLNVEHIFEPTSNRMKYPESILFILKAK